jgi:eukaryotic-like serine/threonine-protein kinase
VGVPTGSRLGPYEILAPLGSGGMGEVYRARDTKLNRTVALKVLPSEFALDADRLARFKREAQVLASLDHPNIAAIYGIEDSEGVHALVLQLVEGPTLADRIAEGPIPIDEALPIARQIAEALEAAHDQGIVHRDLKPANIKVTAEGTVKVLDFGLAKLLDAETAPSSQIRGYSPGLTNSPTITTPAMTMAGVILGTAAYMSPEQAKGKPADKRTDIWAFGCVLFEMLTGKRAFEGEDVSDTLATVLKGEPDWSALPRDIPDRIVALIKRCVTKDPRGRVADVAAPLYVLSESGSGPSVTQSPRDARASSRSFMVGGGVGLMTGILLTALAAWTMLHRPDTQPPRVTRFSITPAPSLPLLIQNQDLAISPDGTHIVYQAGTGPGQLMLRALGDLEPRALADSVGGRQPFFSPDGLWVGFFGAQVLKKVSIASGPSITICDLTSGGPLRGGSWGPDGTIVFSSAAGLMSVSQGGGKPKALTNAGPGEQHVFPFILPNGRAVLFTIRRPAQAEGMQVAVLDLSTSQTKVLIQAGSSAQYVDMGHVVYAAAGTLSAVPFDTARLSVVGDARTIVEHVTTAGAGATDFAVARQGTLVYVPEAPAPVRSLVWVDRQGHEEPINAPPRVYATARFSPDGRRVALGLSNDNRDRRGIWIWDLARETLSPVTQDARGQAPVWTPDGRRIVFESQRGTGVAGLYAQAADGTGNAEQLKVNTGTPLLPTSVSRTGELFFTQVGRGGLSIGVLTVGAGEARTLIEARQLSTPLSSAGLTSAEISPDGRWLAYQSSESSRIGPSSSSETSDIYVRPYPDVDSAKWPISSGGGSRPAWARNGRELFYLDATGRLTTVSVQTNGATFSAGKPAVLFDTRYFAQATGGRSYDVSPDGRRFLMIKEPSTVDNRAPSASIVVVENWMDELKQRVPVK